MSLIVRNPRADEMQAMKALHSAAFAANRAIYRPKATARPILSGGEPDVTRLVAVEDGEVVGTICYWLEGTECHLGAVAVDPRLRGRGVARAMLEHIESICRSKGLSILVASTIRQAGQAGFYERLGFLAAAEREPTWCESVKGELLTEVELRKTLR